MFAKTLTFSLAHPKETELAENLSGLRTEPLRLLDR